MKTSAFLLLAALALPLTVHAECTTKISGVHLCCKSCVTGVEDAVGKVQGVKTEVDQDSGTVTLSAADAGTVQKAADALVAGGYFGKSSLESIKLDPKSGASGKKVTSLKLEGAHLCCGKCVKAVDKAVASVSGAKAHTATKGAKSFEVTGDFNDKELVSALQKEGLSTKVAK
jgi:copper chaperone CopZ